MEPISNAEIISKKLIERQRTHSHDSGLDMESSGEHSNRSTPTKKRSLQDDNHFEADSSDEECAKDSSWGPIFKDRDTFVNMHLC